MIKEYTQTGQCIWCGKTKPEVTFRSEPHIIPEALGGKEIGVDGCDQCNSYFGTATPEVPNMEKVVIHAAQCWTALLQCPKNRRT